MMSRLRNNKISTSRNEDILIQDVDGIKSLMFDNFKRICQESNPRRPRL